MHDEIIRYSLEGELSDCNITQNRQSMVALLKTKMRDEGLVPVFDIDPQFTLDYNKEKETFDFSLSVYGIYIGEESWQVAGVMNGKKTMKPTQKTKLSES